MAALKKATGATLQTGATQCPVSGAHTQTSTRSAAGELVIFRDAAGNDISAYVTDAHTEQTFEAILESSAEDKEIGDVVNGMLVTQWQVTESNEDVKRVTIGLRSTDIGSGSGNNTPAPSDT